MNAKTAYAAGLVLILVGMIPAAAYAQGNCDPATAEAFLDVNNVRARLFNNGGLFWRGSPPIYEVPKGEGAHAIFAASLWVAGLVDGEIRAAATRYGPYSFWPGPLNEDGTLPNAEDCSGFDRIYRVSRRDIVAFEATGVAARDLFDWPWEQGAPVMDGDGDPNNYNLAGGDRPEVLGHQSAWWVMNDVGNAHLVPAAESPPIGLEVQATAFAARSDVSAIDDATLYRYTLRYRGQVPLEEAYVSLFVDSDLGNFGDDYIGSDSTLELGFVYNADNLDEGEGGYGENPPAIGFQFLQTPRADADGRDNDDDGQVDEAGEEMGMTAFVTHENGAGITANPVTAADYYNYMQARWQDGKRITVGGNGRDFSEIPTSFVFSGDPTTRAFWSELNADGQGMARYPADRRHIIATGPFTLQPGETQAITLAIIWARGADHLASVGALKQAARTM